jgi:uncharacterized repeat protein (TIGR03803 family)
METRTSSMKALCACFAAVVLLAATGAAAQLERVAYSFNGSDGAAPNGLIFDSAGNLYGAASSGGSHDVGIIFELVPKSGGGWTEKILHSFNNETTDGYQPNGQLVFDSSGNLYGTTRSGGTQGLGAVFELSPRTSGQWAEKLVYSFRGEGNDGIYPFAGVIFDSAGNLYGTTESGGASSLGTVFKLSLSGGVWTETRLFDLDNTHGAKAEAPLLFDSAGNLYTTAEFGGANNLGTVLELSPQSNGNWTPATLHQFDNVNGSDVMYPVAGLTFDSAGNLYGTAIDGAAYGGGGVFELTPAEGGTWNETIIHSFNYAQGDGFSPQAAVTLGSAGNLYGTTAYGGTGTCTQNGNPIGCGTVFKLTFASGVWTETILHSFTTGTDGEQPKAAVIFNSAGNIFGAATEGGTSGDGAVFEVKP